MKRLVVTVALSLLPAALAAQKFDDLAATPPMGWNSWNRFACNIDEDLVRQTALAMVETGMRDVGYRFVNIDDCWHGRRDERGFIRPDPDRFPSGMRALADFVHAQGLKLGLYSDAGWKTCGGRPGSRGYEFQDALTYAEWGIDYLKYDWCNTEALAAEGAYLTMRDALYAAGRPIVFSICEWGDNEPWDWAPGIGHLWRTTGDITACWDCEEGHGTWTSWGILKVLDKQAGLRQYAGPGHWNDPDMMEVGNGMSEGEDRAHFSLWAMLAAPLIAGNDLRDMSEATRSILTNAAVIAVDQDPLGVEGYKHRDEGDVEIWVRPLADGAWALAVLNRGEPARRVELDWAHENLADGLSDRNARFDEITYSVRDLWLGADLGTTAATLVAEVPGHDVLMLRLDVVAGGED